MGKKRVVAETGAGQHGVATATVCALLGLECVVYMGTEDMARQAPNVRRMRLLGAEVRGVESGARTLKDAINEAMRDWVTNVRTTHYLLGSVLGAHPYPMMVRDFQSVIGEEARAQVLGQAGSLPDLLVACVGGGSNSIGLFFAFLGDAGVRMVGVEAGGRSGRPGDHAARFLVGIERGGAEPHPPEPPRLRAGVNPALRRARCSPAPAPGLGWACSRGHGRISCKTTLATSCPPTRSPLASTIRRSARSTPCSTTKGGSSTRRVGDEEALAAFHLLGETEGILPALESAHAVAWLLREAPSLRDKLVIVNVSGRGDKDLGIVDESGAESRPLPERRS